MKHLFLLPILSFALISSCDSGTNNRKAQEQETLSLKAENANVYYKRFSGSIAGQPVVLHLQGNNGALSGTYYYVKQGRIIGLYILQDTTLADGYNVEESPAERSDTTQAKWKIILKGNAITGKWISADGKKTFDIDLKEAYPAGSYQLTLWQKEDSVRFKAERAQPSATVAYKILRPSAAMQKEDAQFLETLLMQQLGADSLKAMTLEDCVKMQVENYGKWYRETLGEEADSMLDEPWMNYYSGVATDVSYNDNGWLVMELSGSEYTGGAHGNYGVSYLNIDMQNKKLWKMEDIMQTDTAKLSIILETEARKIFGIPANEKLENSILTDKILPNGNVCISNTGLSFVYNPYEIASYADGVITIFIPYSNIRQLLTVQFKQRMGI